MRRRTGEHRQFGTAGRKEELFRGGIPVIVIDGRDGTQKGVPRGPNGSRSRALAASSRTSGITSLAGRTPSTARRG
jgi:hypothetical protein